MANVQAKGMSMGFGVLASICNGVAFTARQGHHVANGLRTVADGIDNVSTKVDTAMLKKAMEYQLKKQAMAEVANMSDEEIAQCAEAVEAQEMMDEAKEVQCQTIDECKTAPVAEAPKKENPLKKVVASVGEVTNKATETVKSKIAVDVKDSDIPFAGNFVGEATI